MKKKWIFGLTSLGIFISLCICLSKSSQKESSLTHIKHTQGAYFYPIPLSKFTAANQPCLPVEINGHEATVILDLGFRGQFSFSSNFLKNIENKTYLHSRKMYGVRGGEYEEPVFEVPEMSIKPIIFYHPSLQEYSDSFQKDSSFTQEGHAKSAPESGKIGWELFENTNLFLDLKNSKMAFCDSLATLKKQGYKTKSFVKTPLLLERGLIELQLETSQGPLLCMLDTGATWNVLNTKLKNGELIDQAIWDPEHEKSFDTFQINRQKFGPITFRCIPIELPIQIDAILGMEFFEEHCVFLDFSENYLYILNNRSHNP
jgi:hypothetical protein